MASVSIRDLDDQVKEQLRIRAARNGRSMEAEIRAILVDAVRTPPRTRSLFTTLLDRFSDIGGVEIEVPARRTRPRAADLSS